jgi:hypothetical protein
VVLPADAVDRGGATRGDGAGVGRLMRWGCHCGKDPGLKKRAKLALWRGRGSVGPKP